MEYDAYRRVMDQLAINYREPLTDPLLDLFWRAFGERDELRFAQAAERHMIAGEFFPRVADLHRALRETATEEETSAALFRGWIEAGMVPSTWTADEARERCRQYGVSEERTRELVGKIRLTATEALRGGAPAIVAGHQRA